MGNYSRDDVDEGTFSESEQEAINDMVSAWHAGKAPEGMSLHEWLGWTSEEYSRWVQNPHDCPSIDYERYEDER